MKRTLMIAALVSSTALSAQAATETDRAQIEQFLPNVDASTLTDTQVDSLVGIMYSGDSRSDKVAAMRGLVGAENPVMTELTPTELLELQSYAPEIDFSRFTAAQIAQAQGIINSAETRADAMAQLRSFELSDEPIMTDALTEAEVVEIRSYAPDINLAALTDVEVLRIQAAIAGGDTTEISNTIGSIVN
ncbi:hypothetical protein [Antarctobacter jejuensis]|uniref:hypothetical protein n=1 Tax=Antarctobacter jejuensis TaxID=1439938 RepID=UPI003FD3343E